MSENQPGPKPEDIGMPKLQGEGVSELESRVAALELENKRLRAELEEEIKKRKEAEQLADVDPLTELLNRRGWQREVETRGIEYARHGTPCAVLMSDLDAFKQVNDALGQDGGDEIIKLYAQVLQKTLREGDTIARIGGDEFYMFLRVEEEDFLDEIKQRIESRFISSLMESEYWDRLQEVQNKTGKKYGVSLGSHHIDWNKAKRQLTESITTSRVGDLLNDAMIEANKKEKLVKESKGAAR